MNTLKSLIKGGLLLFFMFFVLKSYAQRTFTYEGQFAHTKNYIGSEQTGVNATLEKANFDVKHFAPFEALPYYDNTTTRHARTEGSIYATYSKDLPWYESGSGGPWNRIGIINTNATVSKMYRVASNGIYSMTINGDFTYGPNWDDDPYIYYNGSVIELGSKKTDGVAILADVGPGVVNKDLFIAHQWGDGEGGDTRRWYKKWVKVSTTKLKAPTDVTLTESLNGNVRRVTLSYKKGTLYPDGLAAYRVYYRLKGSNSTPNYAGKFTTTTATFNLPTTLGEGEYEFFVQSDLTDSALSSFGLTGKALNDYSEEMVPTNKTVAVVKFDFTASTDKNAKITINWSSIVRKNISQIGGVELFKDNVSLGVFSKNQSTFDDTDVVPGKYYKYKIQVTDESYNPLVIPGVISLIEKEGTSLVNGKISGTVKTSTGAGLSGVEIKITNVGKLSKGSTKLDVAPFSQNFSTVTDNLGAYSFSNIFYSDSATFLITAKVPWTDKKRIEHDSIYRVLELGDFIIKDANFIDTASNSVSGYVYYPNVGGTKVKIPVEGASVFLNGLDVGVRTASNGFYNLPISKIGTHKIQVKVNGHKLTTEALFQTKETLFDSISNGLINETKLSLDSVQTIYVDKDIQLNNFVDMKLVPVNIEVAAYNSKPVGEWSQLSVKSIKETPIPLRPNTTTYRLDKFVNKVLSKDTTLVHSYQKDTTSINYKQIKSGEIQLLLPPSQFKLNVTEVQAKQRVNNGGSEVVSIDRDDIKTDFFKILANGERDIDMAVVDSVFTKDNEGNTIATPTAKRISFTYFKEIRVAVDTLEREFNMQTGVFTTKTESLFNEQYTVTNLGNKIYNVASHREPITKRLKLYHLYAYDNVDYSSVLDTGRLIITNQVADSKDPIPLNFNGLQEIEYNFVVGQPVIEFPWVKKITIGGELGNLKTTFVDSAIVFGERERLGTFYTRGVEKPMFVLHDPPGDNSFSSLAKGTTLTWEENKREAFGGGAGAVTDTKLGSKGFYSFITGDEVGAGVMFHIDLTNGKNTDNTRTSSYSVQLTETFSTSSDPNFVGEDADVFVGNSVNSTYSMTDVVGYQDVDVAQKKIQILRDTILMVDTVGFGTTFNYTQGHIKNVLLPQLNTLKSITENDLIPAQSNYDSIIKLHGGTLEKALDKDSVTTSSYFKTLNDIKSDLTYYKTSIQSWNRVLENNAKNRERAKDRIVTVSAKGNKNNGVFVPGGVVGKNISFSAGAAYENVVQLDSTESSSHEEEVYFESNWELRAWADFIKDYVSSETGIQATAHSSKTTTQVSTTSTSNTVAFTLSDDDPGDYFSVDIGSDPEYGTPVFITKSGASSCPPEDGTQRRFISLLENEGTAVVNNVPATESAKFKIKLTNRSESDEPGTYGVRLVSTTNLNGAKVLVGGQDVTTHEALFTIPTGKSFIVPVELIKGPIDNEYKDLVLVMYPSCEQTLTEAEKTEGYDEDETKSFAKISATFQHNCSEIDMFRPGSNWLVSMANENQLGVTFNNYNASETSPLEYIQLQYRRLNTKGDFMPLGDAIYKNQLTQAQYQVTYLVDKLVDGEYELRAYASCTNGVNYSPVYRGKIDRLSATIFGVPTPKNGILTREDIISVDYTKDIRNDVNNPIKVKLVNVTNPNQLVEIPAYVIVSGKQIRIQTVDPAKLDQLENQQLQASIWNVIDDQSGNLVQDTVEWRFVVSRSNLYWSPNTISMNVEEGANGLFSATVKNKTAIVQDFSLSDFPSWITPSVRNGKVSPQGEIKIDFSIANVLNTGTYSDTVKVVNDGKEQFLYVTVNILKKAPNWSVNPANYKYQMNIVSQFSLSDANTPLSEDTFDKIAVKVGDEVRGVAHIEYDNNLKKYYAYITAYTNNLKDNFNFYFWDARPGMEYIAKEELGFVNGGVVATVNNPFILHPKEVVQTIPLTKGYNWISLFVKNNNMSANNVLKSMKATDGAKISTLINSGVYNEYKENMGWVTAGLDSLKTNVGYKIYVTKADTIRVSGQLSTEEQVQPLNSGWNGVGYPMPFNTELNTYLKNVPFADKTRIVSQEEFAVYDAATKTWSGSLKYMRPNQGYKMYTLKDGEVYPFTTFAAYQSAGNAIAANLGGRQLPRYTTTVESEATSEVIQLSKYEGGMTTTFAFVIGGEEANAANANTKISSARRDGKIEKVASTTTTNASIQTFIDRYTFLAYVENQLVGESQLQALADGTIRGFMASSIVDQHIGKDVSFKVYDTVEKKTYTLKSQQAVQHEDGNALGIIASPVMLVLEGDADIAISTDLVETLMNKGESISYKINVKNSSEYTAVNIEVDELIPSAFDIVSVTADKGKVTVENGKWTYSIVNINKNNEDAISVTLKANQVGVFTLANAEAKLNNDVNLSNNELYGKEVEVKDERAEDSNVFIPSIISPNGDGINDRFEIQGLNSFVKDVNIVIYDKSSTVIFRDNNYQNTWDGGNMPVGSYGYYIKGVNRKGEPVEFRGYVSIVR